MAVVKLSVLSYQNPSHRSFCIRARLQTCRNSSTVTRASAPEDLFLQGLEPNLCCASFGTTKSRALIRLRMIYEMSSRVLNLNGQPLLTADHRQQIGRAHV